MERATVLLLCMCKVRSTDGYRSSSSSACRALTTTSTAATTVKYARQSVRQRSKLSTA
ncbi:hypothetical protein PR003_g3965 [Phytophthora rubi]|uniref:Uncharacterized protein n=1 Tax=Phytophthora rubi TaxID=129364 RepID=A0A6A3NZY2_9STRA|nr:hypothetical protein PR002_g13424 [Phytophthora rubi]KAE9048673.1 hypothetical protein PR001_g3725 [Phytophthora rubi]KAE9353263.1 hypothetical protein PR003_g3965 [Phytophthora rubi]